MPSSELPVAKHYRSKVVLVAFSMRATERSGTPARGRGEEMRLMFPVLRALELGRLVIPPADAPVPYCERLRLLGKTTRLPRLWSAASRPGGRGSTADGPRRGSPVTAIGAGAGT